MLLICNKSNKKSKSKNDKDQLILGQKYVLHNNYSGQKQGGNLIFLPFKRSLNSFCALWAGNLSKLGQNGLLTLFTKIHISS